MKMKQTFILAAFILGMNAANAQNLRFGLSAGVDASRFALSGASGGPVVYKNNAAGGLSLEAKVSDNFGIQLDASYSSQGGGVINEDGSTAGSYQFDYITVPIVAKLYGTKNLSFIAGPQVGFLLKANTRSSGDPDQDVKDQLEEIDFYAVFGSEYRFNNGVFVSSRYHVGVTNLVKDESTNTDIKNRYFSFRIGYSMPLGGSKKK
jgi:hypothetical protein